jgi:uncharacterized damage-inducible protein DinB
MISPAFARVMADYNAELNRRVYAAAGRLTDARRREDGGAFWRSIHATFSHLLWADRMWMQRFAGWDGPGVPLSQSGAYHAGPFEDLRERRVALDADLIAWTDGLDEAWLAGDLVWFSGSTGREMRRPRALLVAHLFNHQTHHRGQAHALLTRFGEDTGATDLPFVLG